MIDGIKIEWALHILKNKDAEVEDLLDKEEVIELLERCLLLEKLKNYLNVSK